MRPRYWRFGGADTVAVHDTDEVGGPPGGRVVVALDKADNAATVSVYDPARGELALRLNHGAARWLGVRLIEAAALDEAAGHITSDNEAEVAIDRLADWMRENGIEYLVPGQTMIDCALTLLGDAKRVLAERQRDPDDPYTVLLSTLRADIRAALNQNHAGQRSLLLNNIRGKRGAAIRERVLTPDQWRDEVVGWFSPADQALLRGLGL